MVVGKLRIDRTSGLNLIFSVARCNLLVYKVYYGSSSSFASLTHIPHALIRNTPKPPLVSKAFHSYPCLDTHHADAHHFRPSHPPTRSYYFLEHPIESSTFYDVSLLWQPLDSHSTTFIPAQNPMVHFVFGFGHLGDYRELHVFSGLDHRHVRLPV